MKIRRVLWALGIAALAAALIIVTVRSTLAEKPATSVVALAEPLAEAPPAFSEREPAAPQQGTIVAVAGYNGQADYELAVGPPPEAARVYFPTTTRDDPNTTLFIQNIGEITASVHAEFYDSSGTPVYTDDNIMPPHGSLTYELATMAGLPAGFEGSAVVSADQPILAVANLQPTGADVLLSYTGLLTGSTEIALTTVMRNWYGWHTDFWVQNIGSTDADVTLYYNPALTGTAHVATDTIPAFASHVYRQADMPELGSSFSGWGLIQADQPIVVVGEQWDPSATKASAYSGLVTADADTAFLSPRQQSNADGWSTSTAIANLGSVDANISLNWYASDGSGVWTENSTIAAGMFQSYYLPSLPGIPDGFDGTLVGSADQPVVAWVGLVNLGLSGDDRAASLGFVPGQLQRRMHLPRVAHVTEELSTEFSVQNAAPLAATVTISYYHQSGAVTTVVTDTIPALGVSRYATGDVGALGDDWEGTVTISATQPIAVEAVQFLTQPSTCPVVSDPADSGPNTLRGCLEAASAGDTITFDTGVFPPGDPQTIMLTSGPLPDITQGNLTVDGSNAGVVLDGQYLSSGDGLHITSDGNTIKGLQIIRFPDDGVEISGGAKSNTIGGDWTVGSAPHGEGNVLSGNGFTQVAIAGIGTDYNTIRGNCIGTDASGLQALDGGYGVRVEGGAQYNVVGGTTSGERNLISGNQGGVVINDSGTMSNTVVGNYIGTDASGMAALGNGLGVSLNSGSQRNRVGGVSPSERNVISGNHGDGVWIQASGTTYNVVSGNYIGTNVSGTVVISNTENGVRVSGGASLNLIGGSNATPGGTCSGECNLISGNSDGVSIEGAGTASNTVSGNYIGTDASGTAALPNILHGVEIDDGASYNLIGDDTPSERNLIGGNAAYGVSVRGSGTRYNTVMGNYIGVDASGTLALGNSSGGVTISYGASENLIGDGNVIAYSNGDGVGVWDATTLGNTITQNSIFSNSDLGINLHDGGNAELSPPALTDTTATSVSGIAPVAYATVEIFSDDEDEGRVYEGTTTADAGGLFSFSKPEGFTGPYLTATATDAGGNTSEFSGPVQVACVGLTGVSISGPSSGYTGTLYGFTAAITPGDATAPVTYTWSPEPASGQGTAGTTYQWAAPGIYTVTLVAGNCQPSFAVAVSDTHTITISAPPPGCPHPLSDVSISGPTEGYTGTLYTFTAVITPSDATEPITYTWSPTPTLGQGKVSASYRWDTSGPHIISLKAENCGAPAVVAVSNTHTITISATLPPGDAYEPDDTCAQAQSIPTDGSVQVHTFHDTGDEDWAFFEVVSGTEYLIEAVTPADSLADVNLALYDACGAVATESQDHSFSPDVRLHFTAPLTGTLKLRLRNSVPDTAGTDVSYHLSIRSLAETASPGALVLVAGRLKQGDPLQGNIHNVTNGIYNLFLEHGYPKDRIYYLATNQSMDADGNGFPDDVDEAPDRTTLETVITTWAAGKQLGPERAFTLYLMDHGGGDKFYLNGPSQTVSPDDLDAWLSTLEAAAPGVRVNVIMEACHSGSFVDSLGKDGRVVIASTAAHAVAYASQDGAIFSDTFLEALERGLSLFGSFQEAQWDAETAHLDQISWLDDDGDGLPNGGGDGLEASRRGFAYAGTFAAEEKWPPYIVWAQVRDLQDDEGVIEAEVRDDQRVDFVWAVIYEPSYTPPDPDVTEEMPQEVLSTVTLLDLDHDNIYSARYEGFDEVGEYRLVIYATDNEDLDARPRAVELVTGVSWEVYLPLVVRDL
jgi:hypothetical protein